MEETVYADAGGRLIAASCRRAPTPGAPDLANRTAWALAVDGSDSAGRRAVAAVAPDAQTLSSVGAADRDQLAMIRQDRALPPTSSPF